MRTAFNFRELKTKFRQVDLSTLLFILMLVVFLGTATFFALNLKRDIVPDEGHHIGISIHFATTSTIPPDVPDTYIYGTLQHQPFLYYWINGRLLNAAR